MLAPEHHVAETRAGVLRRWLPWLLLGTALLALSFLGDAFFDGWFEHQHSKSLRHVARTISFFGDWPSLTIGAAAIGVLGAAVRRRCWRIVCLMVLAASLAGLTANVTRCLTGRTRPHAGIAQGWQGPPVGKNAHLANHDTNSFPSAHTTTAMAYFVTLLLLAPRVGIWFLPAPLLVGVSRLYLGAHHFSDVCAGLLLGTVVAYLTCRILAPQWPRFQRRFLSRPPSNNSLNQKTLHIPLEGQGAHVIPNRCERQASGSIAVTS